MAEGNAPFDHGRLELAKWVAIVTMAIDHYGKIVEPALYEPTHLIGRVSFPLFAVTELARSYGKLSLWAVGPLGLLANLRIARAFWTPLDTPALLASPIMWTSWAVGGSLPRLPKYFFYLFYPGHLLVLHCVDLYL